MSDPTLTPDEQLRRWVDGKSECPNTDGECCPDFSCCMPHLLAPEPARRAFAASPPEQREQWLGAFLRGALDDAASAEGITLEFTNPRGRV